MKKWLSKVIASRLSVENIDQKSSYSHLIDIAQTVLKEVMNQLHRPFLVQVSYIFIMRYSAFVILMQLLFSIFFTD